MAKKKNNKVRVGNLPKAEKKLSAKEQKKVKGGVIRSVGNRDGGGTNVISGGSISGQDS